MHRVELLAPAGTKASFIGAINAGANAIFMAGQRYGARAFADNFSETELEESIFYAHTRGVEVFIVVNTLMFDNEIEALLSYTDTLVKHKIDALIVQDLGLIKLFCDRYPNTPIHASTQVNAHNIAHVKFLKSLGVKRVILARETSIDVIRQIKQEIDIELEVFIHGALCVSYSGNCLMSSILNKRSGNRGACSYSCRLPYELIKDDEVISESSYLMSAKDLMTIEYINELIEAGVDSFKIEGRMRKPEYVIQTVLSYRKAIDAYLENKTINTKEEISKLERVFNRDYTKGYMFNEIPKDINNSYRPNHVGIKAGVVLDYQKGFATIKLSESLRNGDGYRVIGEIDYGNDVTYMEDKTGKIIKEAYAGQTIKLEVKQKVIIGSDLYKTTDSALEKGLEIYLNTNYKVFPLKGYVKAYVDKKLTLSVSVGSKVLEVSSEEELAFAINQPTLEDSIMDSFKLGDTPFYFEELIVYTDQLTFVPKKVISDLRRQMVEMIYQTQTIRTERTIKPSVFHNGFVYNDQESLIVKVHTKDQMKAAIEAGIETIYYDDILDITGIEHSNLIPVKKRIYEQDSDYLIKGPSVINEIGMLIHNETKYPLYAEEFLNVTNIYTANVLSNFGVERITLSSELDAPLVSEFSNRYLTQFGGRPNLEMVIYGKKDLMISKYCPVAKSYGYKPNCKLCFKNQYYLKDQSNGKFALLNDGNCNMRIMDSMPVVLIDKIESLRNAHIKTFRLDFTTESSKQTKEIILSFKRALEGKVKALNILKFRTGRYV